MTHGSEGISPRILETLRRLGLTEYGARCYVALLSLRSAEASAIAEAAEVPRTKVYATLKDLVDAGWVLAEGGRPVIYRAVAPDERILREEKRIAEEVSDATRELQARFQLGTQMFPVSMYMLRGRDAVDAKSLEIISRAREDLLVNLAFLLPNEAAPLAAALEKAAQRGVVIRVMCGAEVDAKALGALGRDARPALFPFRAIVCDSRQALVVFPGDEVVALWNPTQAFVELVAPLLRAAWERAVP